MKNKTDLFLSCCSCGLCSSKDSLCSKCEVSTLTSNGLDEKYATEIHGLKKHSSSHSNGFKYSELYKKLVELSTNN